MGNNHTSHVTNEIEWPRNEFGYLKIKISEIDSVFERAGQLFDDFEFYRISIRHNMSKAHSLAGTDQLKDSPVLYPFRIMLWSFSVAVHGNLQASFSLKTDPILRFDIPKIHNMSEQTWELYKVCDDLLTIYSESANLANSISERAYQIHQEISDMNKDDFLKAVAYQAGKSRKDLEWLIEQNSDMFNSVYNIMFTWNNIHIGIGQDFATFIDNINSYLKEADFIGREASKKNLSHPKEILIAFQHYL